MESPGIQPSGDAASWRARSALSILHSVADIPSLQAATAARHRLLIRVAIDGIHDQQSVRPGAPPVHGSWLALRDSPGSIPRAGHGRAARPPWGGGSLRHRPGFDQAAATLRIQLSPAGQSGPPRRAPGGCAGSWPVGQHAIRDSPRGAAPRGTPPVGLHRPGDSRGWARVPPPPAARWLLGSGNGMRHRWRWRSAAPLICGPGACCAAPGTRRSDRPPRASVVPGGARAARD